MTSKPVVYVSRITNLSDARYCAGMGADLLGFVVDPEDRDYVSPQTYQEMVGWVSGPKRVVQLNNLVDFAPALTMYKPEFLHVPFGQLVAQSAIIPLIIECPYLAYGELLQSNKSKAAYIVLSDLPNQETLVAMHKEKPFEVPVLLKIDAHYGNVRELLKSTGAAGVMLAGEKEFQPGLKDYDHLAGVLGELEG